MWLLHPPRCVFSDVNCLEHWMELNFEINCYNFMIFPLCVLHHKRIQKLNGTDLLVWEILIFKLILILPTSWRKRLDARLPPLESRVRVSVTPCGFRGGRNGFWVGFRGVSPVFPYHKFHSTISPHSSHPFRSISSALVMVRQAWSAGTLATHGPIISGLHRISSLDPTLCWTRVEDIYVNFKI